jgi:nucleotide-binding universal stress UspA family protein
MIRSILVATDGKAGALGVLRFARQIADRDGASVEVVTVYEPIDSYMSGTPGSLSYIPPPSTPSGLALTRERVETGRVARTIADLAADRGADLVAVGLRQPGAIERWLGRATLLRLVALSRNPVVAVPPDATESLDTVVVPIDFSEISERVWQSAIQTAAPGANVHLVHVISPAASQALPEDAEWIGELVREYRADVDRRMMNLADQVASVTAAAIATHILEGDPATEVLQLAESVGANLIATGSHGAGLIERSVVGSVTSKIAHGAACALLIVPPKLASG